jgi:hypothetical protein
VIRHSICDFWFSLPEYMIIRNAYSSVYSRCFSSSPRQWLLCGLRVCTCRRAPHSDTHREARKRKAANATGRVNRPNNRKSPKLISVTACIGPVELEFIDADVGPTGDVRAGYRDIRAGRPSVDFRNRNEIYFTIPQETWPGDYSLAIINPGAPSCLHETFNVCTPT